LLKTYSLSWIGSLYHVLTPPSNNIFANDLFVDVP